jgi:hypothetical protein
VDKKKVDKKEKWIKEDGLEIASPLIARSSQCAFRNDDRASAMRRLEKNPKDFLIREIRNKWKVKIKNS